MGEIMGFYGRPRSRSDGTERLLNQTYVIKLFVGLWGSYLLLSKEVVFKNLELKELSLYIIGWEQYYCKCLYIV